MIQKKFSYIAGVDEVGRGPLIGNIVAAAVILDPKYRIKGIQDSKKLTEKKREKFYEQILQNSICWAIGEACPQEIYHINTLQASLLAMKRAILALKIVPNKVLIDGNTIPNGLGILAEAIVSGDVINSSISAASIVAKVKRDRDMLILDEKYPEYGFSKHKGYPTKLHIHAIQKHGILPDHRLNFRPIKNIVKQT